MCSALRPAPTVPGRRWSVPRAARSRSCAARNCVSSAPCQAAVRRPVKAMHFRATPRLRRSGSASPTAASAYVGPVRCASVPAQRLRLPARLLHARAAAHLDHHVQVLTDGACHPGVVARHLLGGAPSNPLASRRIPRTGTVPSPQRAGTGRAGWWSRRHDSA